MTVVVLSLLQASNGAIAEALSLHDVHARRVGTRVTLSVCLSAGLSAGLPVCLSVCLPVCLPACLPACRSVCQPACLPTCLSVCLPACLTVCLCVCLTPGMINNSELYSFFTVAWSSVDGWLLTVTGLTGPDEQPVDLMTLSLCVREDTT